VHRDKLRVKSSDLPPRREETGSPAARSVTLRTPPGPASVKDALEEACEIFDGVMAGTWAWPVADAMDEEEGRVTRAIVEKLAERLRNQLVGERMAETTWQRTWGPYLAALADVAGRENGPPELILASYLQGWGPNSRARQMAHDRARTLWKVAGLPWPSIILACGAMAAPLLILLGCVTSATMRSISCASGSRPAASSPTVICSAGTC
jgi:hypothetical protein